MKKDGFEAMIEVVLSDMVKNSTKPSAKRSRGLTGLRYGPAERAIGGAVKELTRIPHSDHAKSIVAPAPEFVPPCF